MGTVLHAGVIRFAVALPYVSRSLPPEVREHVPIAALTTLGVGGPARFFATGTTRESIGELALWARERAVPLLVLGGGSNLLVADTGFPGLVLRVANEEVSWQRGGGVIAGAGVVWDSLVEAAVARGLAGVECLSGIPGAVGATPIQNVGAYGQEVRETIRCVDALDLETGRKVTFSNAECSFGYRESRFKRDDAGRYIVLSVAYTLATRGAPAVRYAELSRYFDVRAVAAPTLSDVRRAVLEIRRAKSMVLDPTDWNGRSAGSFFVNPTLDAVELERVEAAAEALGAGPVPRFPAQPGRVKVPAAWLIERAGFSKGYARGRAAISTRHALAIVNRGGATATEIAALAREIRDMVWERFGVQLVPEPVLVGITLEGEPVAQRSGTSSVPGGDGSV